MNMLVYHGISSHQRKGDALSKLKSIIECGFLYPQEDLQENIVTRARSKLAEHAFYNVYEGEPIEIDIVDYIKRNSEDREFYNSEEIRILRDHPEALRRYGLDKLPLDPTGGGREYVNWVSDDKEETESLYGSEIYLVLDIPKNWLIRGSHGFFVPKPIRLERARKLVISERYSDKVSEIQRLLKERGLKNLEIEIRRDKKGLEKILLIISLSLPLFLFFLLVKAEITSSVIGFKDSRNILVFFIVLILVLIIIFIRKHIKIFSEKNL